MNSKLDTSAIELIKKLSMAFGPSGCEDNVAEIIENYVSPYADEIFHDNLGSVIAVYHRRVEEAEYDPDEEPGLPLEKPDVKKLMLCAPMDEAGFMIKSIDSDGYLKIAPLKGKSLKTLAGRNVTVGNESNKVIGYFGIKPTHLGGSGNFDSLYIDIGAKDKDDAKKYVSIGDFGTYRSDFIRFGKDDSLIKGKALNSRAGCAILCEILKTLKETNAALPFDVYFAFTCRDEISRSSAGAAASKVAPDCAVTVKGESADDISGEGYTASASLGGGATISIMDKGTIYDEEINSFIDTVAKKHALPIQPKKYVSAANGAAHLNRSLIGVKCAEISFPVRYSHTSCCVAAEADIAAVQNLLSAFISELAEHR